MKCPKKDTNKWTQVQSSFTVEGKLLSDSGSPYLFPLRLRMVRLSRPLIDSGPSRLIWFPVTNRLLVYPGIPAGKLRRSLETHFTVSAISEHSQRWGHGAQTEPRSAQSARRRARSRMMPGGAHRRRGAGEGCWRRSAAPGHPPHALSQLGMRLQLCVRARRVFGRLGFATIEGGLGGSRQTPDL